MANVHPNLQHCFIIERLDVQLLFQQNTDMHGMKTDHQLIHGHRHQYFLKTPFIGLLSKLAQRHESMGAMLNVFYFYFFDLALLLN